MAEPPREPANELTRRSFVTRVSLAAFGAYAAVSTVGATRARARPHPDPCKVACEPISKTGCACGGNLYRCSGCSKRFHACIQGRAYRGFCLRRTC